MAKKDNLYAVHGATIKCSQGSFPMMLRVTSNRTKKINNRNVATIMDNKPMLNVGLFGICKVLTKSVPVPCACATVLPWKNGYSSEKVCNFPPLLGKSTLQCSIGGKITITNPGQKREDTKAKNVKCSVCNERHPEDLRLFGTNRRGEVTAFAFAALNKNRTKANKITSQNHLFYRELDKSKVKRLKDALKSLKDSLGDGVAATAKLHQLRKTFMLIPDSVQVHHLISVEAVGGTDDKFDEKWYSICYRYGYDINCAQNSVVLPSDMLSACHFKVPLHKGNHGNTCIKDSELDVEITYVTKVIDLAKRVKRNYMQEVKPCEKIEPDEILGFHEDMLDVSDEIFDHIKNFEWCITSDGFHYRKGSHIGCLDYCKSLGSKKKVLSEKFSESMQKDDSQQGFLYKVMNKIDHVKKGCPSKRVHTAEGCKVKPPGFWEQARYDKMPTEEELGLK